MQNEERLVSRQKLDRDAGHVGVLRRDAEGKKKCMGRRTPAMLSIPRAVEQRLGGGWWCALGPGSVTLVYLRQDRDLGGKQ